MGKIESAKQTVVQDPENKVEILFLKYKSELQDKLDFKFIQSQLELTKLSDGIKNKVLSSFKDQTKKYISKTLSYNFCLDEVEYGSLIATSESKLIKKIAD